jgi:hypothetical protein
MLSPPSLRRPGATARSSSIGQYSRRAVHWLHEMGVETLPRGIAIDPTRLGQSLARRPSRSPPPPPPATAIMAVLNIETDNAASRLHSLCHEAGHEASRSGCRDWRRVGRAGQGPGKQCRDASANIGVRRLEPDQDLPVAAPATDTSVSVNQWTASLALARTKSLSTMPCSRTCCHRRDRRTGGRRAA